MPRQAHPWFRASRKRWYVTMHGQQVPLSVTDPLDEAKAIAEWLVLRRQQQQKPAALVPEVVTAYLRSAAQRVKPHTLTVYTGYLRQFGKSFPDTPAVSLTADQLEADARRTTWSSSTRHTYLGTVSSCLRWAKVTLDRPIRKPPKQSAGARALVDYETYRACLVGAPGDWGPVITFLWETGCRPSEAAAVTAAAVDWELGVVRLREHKTEHAGGDRVIYLNAEALRVLMVQRANYRDGLLFRGHRGQRIGPRSFVWRFGKLSAKVGRRVVAYGFRHSFATRALAAGESDVLVAALLGHKGTTMVNRHYAHVGRMGRELKAVVERIGKAG